MTRRSNWTQERQYALVLAQHLIDGGYENYSCLRWRHIATGYRLSRNDLSTLGHRLNPDAPVAYLKSERFFNHVAFAALEVRKS